MTQRTRIRAGMVGGGPGAGIGETHRIAMRMDGRFDLVAGVFSRDAGKSARLGRSLGINAGRIYRSHTEMAEKESKRPDGLDCVAIATPHDSHCEIARAFLGRGIHVICDKPLALTLNDAVEMERLVETSRCVFVLTHNYSGYPMVRQAARMVREGSIGRIRVVQVEHAHGRAIAPQRLWRMDPNRAGRASVLFDLGTHAHHIARFVTGLEVTEVAAQLSTATPGRQVYDNAQILLRFSNGATGTLWASMVAVGQEHGLRFRVFGETGSLHWRHEDSHRLKVRHADTSSTVLVAGQIGLAAEAMLHARVGPGHSEGYFAAFANLYSEAANAIETARQSQSPEQQELGFPGVRDGVIGVQFVESAMQSQECGSAWTGTGVGP